MRTLNLFSFMLLALFFLSTNLGFAQSNSSHHPEPTIIYTDSTAAMVVTEGTSTTMRSGRGEWIIIQSMSSPIFRNTGELQILLGRGGNALQRIPNGPIRIQLPRTQATKLRTEVLRGQVRIKELVVRIPSGSSPYVIRMQNVLISSYQSSGSAGGDSIPQDSFSINFSKIEY